MIEKIDIIDTAVYCYDEQYALIKTLDLADFKDVDFAYLEGAKLFSLNVTQPIKRVVNFTELNGLDTQAEFTEYPYSDMDDKQKADFDSFVLQAEFL